MPHIHEKIDYCVNAMIVHDRKVLLVDHKKLKTWMPVGGHIELDEDPDQALVREVKEECGLEIEVLSDKPNFTLEGTKPLYRPHALDIHDIDATHKHVGMVYYCKSTSADVRLAEQEHTSIRWFSRAELDDDKFAIRPSIRYYAKEALQHAGL